MITSAVDQQAGRPASPASRPSVLGSFAVPELQPVGIQRPVGPLAPSRWAPSPPQPQYGIDYSFLRWEDGEPVRWRHDRTVTVQLAAPAVSESHVEVLAGVVVELASLTGLDLRSAPLVAGPAGPGQLPEGEIRVSYLAAGDLGWAGPAGGCASHAGTGGARTGTDPRYFQRGIAIINTDVAGTDPASPVALVSLRHELGHALGLGHAARISQVMHRAISGRASKYGRGDCHGLALLGQPRRANREFSHDLDTMRSPLCAICRTFP